MSEPREPYNAEAPAPEPEEPRATWDELMKAGVIKTFDPWAKREHQPKTKSQGYWSIEAPGRTVATFIYQEQDADFIVNLHEQYYRIVDQWPWWGEANLNGKTLEQAFADEMHDYKMVIDHCTRVYFEASGGAISKPQTLPENVVGLLQARFATAEAEAAADAVEALIAGLEDWAGTHPWHSADCARLESDMDEAGLDEAPCICGGAERRTEFLAMLDMEKDPGVIRTNLEPDDYTADVIAEEIRQADEEAADALAERLDPSC